MKLSFSILWTLLLLPFLLMCSDAKKKNAQKSETEIKGSLYIIGGGSRPDSMVKEMVKLSGADTAGYIIILPMASSIPDTAAFYGIKQFKDLGYENTYSLYFTKEQPATPKQLDSLRNASLIYISGGNQANFMEAVADTEAEKAIKTAYKNGSMIAGTSAGAAVMSKKMITGDERKHPEYTGFFPTIEANNLILAEGLGMIDNAIIDQHFIQRQRLNRLIAVCLENPEDICIGIDESTAIHVKGDSAKVRGESQVIVLEHPEAETKIANGLLGGKNLRLSIYLPDESFIIK
jgi:cyanophycinase